MPLDNSALSDALLDILDGTTPVPTAADAGNAWANAYHAYANGGGANAVPPTTPPTAATALGAALGATFGTTPGSPGGAAAGIAGALDLYWPQSVFAGMVAPPVPGGGAALISTLTSIFSTVGGTHASKVSEIVTAIQAYTNAVIVTFPPSVTFPVI